jgi:hypothetical protein
MVYNTAINVPARRQGMMTIGYKRPELNTSFRHESSGSTPTTLSLIISQCREHHPTHSMLASQIIHHLVDPQDHQPIELRTGLYLQLQPSQSRTPLYPI